MLLIGQLIIFIFNCSTGFGSATPKTNAGKIVTILLGLPGCACCALLFNLFLERTVTLIAFVLRQLRLCWRRRRFSLGQSVTSNDGDDHNDDVSSDNESIEWKPAVYSVIIVFFVTAALIASCASALYHAGEHWSYVDTFYYCFVAFATIGFGDLVSGDNATYPCDVLYRIANLLFLLLGSCVVYSLNNVTSIIIKLFLNYIIAKLNNFRCGPGVGDVMSYDDDSSDARCRIFNRCIRCNCCCRRCSSDDSSTTARSQVIIVQHQQQQQLPRHRSLCGNSIHPISTAELERQSNLIGYRKNSGRSTSFSGEASRMSMFNGHHGNGANSSSSQATSDQWRRMSRSYRRNSFEEVSLGEFLRVDKIAMAMMQKELYESAQRRPVDGGSVMNQRHHHHQQPKQQQPPRHHDRPAGPSRSTSRMNGDVGPLAIIDNKLNRENR